MTPKELEPTTTEGVVIPTHQPKLPLVFPDDRKAEPIRNVVATVTTAEIVAEQERNRKDRIRGSY